MTSLGVAHQTFRTDPTYLIDTWEIDDGLPENSATAMVQTPDGYLWIGTREGLARFDGVRFTVFDVRTTPELGHNFVLADGRCNGDKADRLAAFEHLGKWCARNARPDWTAALESRMLPHDFRRTSRVAGWAYAQAEAGHATVWQRGRDGMVGLDRRWRGLLRA